jgi:hypothetical protein
VTAVVAGGGVAVAAGRARPRPVDERHPAVVVRVTADEAASLHRNISSLVREARHKLASRADRAKRELVLDLSAVPPVPAVAPLLLLVRLLRSLLGPGGRVSVTWVTPALVGALAAFALPDGVDLVDRRGRRWPS